MVMQVLAKGIKKIEKKHTAGYSQEYVGWLGRSMWANSEELAERLFSIFVLLFFFNFLF
jgi:hypothetical protein